jgi:asparagine synthase (glutamine-hydrolysing)
MVSDVPVGIFLSGGVDSSVVVALASENSYKPVTTYSIGFDGSPEYTELEYAREIARRFRTNDIERVVRKRTLRSFSLA